MGRLLPGMDMGIVIAGAWEVVSEQSEPEVGALWSEPSGRSPLVGAPWSELSEPEIGALWSEPSGRSPLVGAVGARGRSPLVRAVGARGRSPLVGAVGAKAYTATGHGVGPVSDILHPVPGSQRCDGQGRRHLDAWRLAGIYLWFNGCPRGSVDCCCWPGLQSPPSFSNPPHPSQSCRSTRGDSSRVDGAP